MKVFVTGATGKCGMPIVDALTKAGHQVTGMARSDEGVAKLKAKGVAAVEADLDSIDIIKAEAAKADAVIHLAFIHDARKLPEAVPTELKVVGAIMDALEGSNKVFLITSATGILGDVIGATEDAEIPDHPVAGRAAAEKLIAQGVQRGVRSAAIRLPIFAYEETGGHLFLEFMRGVAQQQGAALYVGPGTQEISVVNIKEVAQVYVKALQHAKAGGIYHVTHAPTVTLKELAAAIGADLKLPTKSISPEEAVGFYGPFLGYLFGINNVTDSSKTRRELQWEPTVGGKSDFLAAVARAAA